jgi:hypothetical protein
MVIRWSFNGHSMVIQWSFDGHSMVIQWSDLQVEERSDEIPLCGNLHDGA